MAIKPLGKVTDYEAGLIKAALGDLKTNIEKVRVWTPLNGCLANMSPCRVLPSLTHLSSKY